MQIEELWLDLSRSASAAQRRIDAHHPHDLYADFEPPDRPGLLIVTSERPPDRRSFRAIQISTGARSDQRWFIRIQLIDPSLLPVFAELCRDVVETTRTGTPREQLSKSVFTRIDHWDALLRKDAPFLSGTRLRGLIGELLILLTEVIPNTSTDGAIASWLGPMRLPQDFSMPSGTLVEIKTTSPGEDSVQINGLGQLDANGKPLDLYVVRLDDRFKDSGDSVSAQSLIDSIRMKLQRDSGSLARFDGLLRLSGWHPDHPDRDRRFLVLGIDKFRIDDSFPKITRSMVSPEIVSATYRISLPRKGLRND
jgi:hypothetical protein